MLQVKVKVLAAKVILDVLFIPCYPPLQSTKGERTVLEFRTECIQGLSNMVLKVQEKSPLKYPVVRQMACLDPTVMYSDPDSCRRQMKGLVNIFLEDKQLTGVSAGSSSGTNCTFTNYTLTKCIFISIMLFTNHHTCKLVTFWLQ